MTAWKPAVLAELRVAGWHAEPVRHGITGVPGVAIVTKKRGPHLAAVKDANQQAHNANAAHGVAWIKRRGKTSALDGYVVMDGHTFLNLLRDAGY